MPCFQFPTMFTSPIYILLVVFRVVVCLISSETCEKKSEFKPNIVILPHQSVDAGAKFIDTLSVNSMHECYFACCQIAPSCTRAVYKSKSPRRCFLFDCGLHDVCIYDHRSNYNLISMSYATGQQMAKLGEVCTRHHICLPNHSVCSNGLCTCQSGWIRKESFCVPSICKSPDLQFQCNDSSTCVAIYDRCNGIIECPDASDEAHCPTETPTTENSTKASLHLNDNIHSTRNEQIHLLSHTQNTPNGPTDLSEFGDTFAIPRFEHMSSTQIVDEISEPVENPFFSSSHARYSTLQQRPSPRQLHRERAPGIPVYWNLGRETKRPLSSLHRQAYTDYLVEPTDDRVFEDDREKPENWVHNSVPVVRASHERLAKSYHIDDSFSEMDTEDDRRLSVPFNERIVDPSVLRHVSPGMSEHRLPVSTHSEPTSHEVAIHSYEAESMNKKKEETAVVPSPSDSASHTDVFSMLRQNQSQSHTAALILAFSLGLVCCFICLLIMECRRRHGHRTWAMRRRPARISVPFDGRSKSTSGLGRPQSFRSCHSTASDEDGKPLYDGMVL